MAETEHVRPAEGGSLRDPSRRVLWVGASLVSSVACAGLLMDLLDVWFVNRLLGFVLPGLPKPSWWFGVVAVLVLFTVTVLAVHAARFADEALVAGALVAFCFSGLQVMRVIEYVWPPGGGFVRGISVRLAGAAIAAGLGVLLARRGVWSDRRLEP